MELLAFYYLKPYYCVRLKGERSCGCSCGQARRIEIFWSDVQNLRNQTQGLQTNVWEVKNTTERFLVQLQPSEFASKVLCLVP